MRDFSTELIQAWRDHISQQLLPLLTLVRVGGLIAAAIALWGFATLADDVLDQETHQLDLSILLSLHEIHRPWLDTVMLGLTFLGEPWLLTIASLVVGVWLLWRQQRSEAMTLAIAAVGATGLNLWLKTLFGRARPELWERIVDVRYYSFPSGHAMLSMVVYGLLGYLLATYLRNWRLSIVSLTIALILSIGFSRLYFGVHWPTDIIAGYAAGFVWLITCVLSIKIWHQRAAIQRDA